MGMTLTQKILAAHAGLAEVKAGQLINAKLDIVLGNDITTPVAINEFAAQRAHCHRAGPLFKRHPEAVPRVRQQIRYPQLLRCGPDGPRSKGINANTCWTSWLHRYGRRYGQQGTLCHQVRAHMILHRCGPCTNPWSSPAPGVASPTMDDRLCICNMGHRPVLP